MPDMTSTQERRAAIRALLLESPVRNQLELREKLRKRGHAASQPVLSRDLRALGVAKRGGSYQVLENERVTPLTALRSLLRGSAPAAAFVMVDCEPGAASAIARALEAEDLQGVVGTLAGDDTVLVAVASAAAGDRVRKRVTDLLGLAAGA